MKSIYLDYAATTPVDERVVQEMLPYFTEKFGNPSSVYSYGREARQAVREARSQVAQLLQADSSEIFFTSGGSESDNWVLKGVAFAKRRAGKGNHIIVSQIEHHAVLHTCQWLEQAGFAITYLPVDANGCITVEAVAKALRPETILVSIMTANNEVGTIEPIAEIGAMLHANGIFFHTDAVQAAGHISLAVKELNVDALSLSGHKFYGPKGIGALFLRRGTEIDALIHGGAQELEMRAGTENTPAIVGIGMAAKLAKAELGQEWARLSNLRDELIKEIISIDGAWINGDTKYRLPGNVNFGIEGISQDVLLIRLDMAGFCVSAGSACSAGSLEPSHVLLAMGQSPTKASAAVRVTMGRFTTETEIKNFAAKLKEIVQAIRNENN